ncbi:MAG: VanZ family protein [Gammaproteobacteria bacterium]
MQHPEIDNVLFNSNFRYKRIILSVALAAIVLMLMFAALPDINLFWREMQNSGHTLLFIPIVLLILLLLRDTTEFFWRKTFKLYIATFSISLLIGIAIELIQLLTHGDASTMDVVRDLAGIIVGLGLYATTDPELQTHKLKPGKWIRAGIVMLSFCVLTASMSPLVFLSAAYVQRETAFPVVVDLTANWTRPFLQLKNAVITFQEYEEVRADGEGQLTRVDLKPGIYPGVSIIEPSPDWSAYKALTIVIYSKLIQPFDLVLRIHDEHHNDDYSDRYNTKLTVNKGSNYFRIPLDDIKNSPSNREMNMMRIKELILVSAKPFEGLHFYVGKMRLE